jgi:hypothetical protein
VSKLSTEIEEAFKKLKKAEIVLRYYEDEELQELEQDVKEARTTLTNAIHQIISRAVQTERQQQKWLKALYIVDEGLSELEDKLTQEEFDIIRKMRKDLDDTFDK